MKAKRILNPLTLTKMGMLVQEVQDEIKQSRQATDVGIRIPKELSQ